MKATDRMSRTSIDQLLRVNAPAPSSSRNQPKSSGQEPFGQHLSRAREEATPARTDQPAHQPEKPTQADDNEPLENPVASNAADEQQDNSLDQHVADEAPLEAASPREDQTQDETMQPEEVDAVEISEEADAMIVVVEQPIFTDGEEVVAIESELPTGKPAGQDLLSTESNLSEATEELSNIESNAEETESPSKVAKEATTKQSTDKQLAEQSTAAQATDKPTTDKSTEAVSSSSQTNDNSADATSPTSEEKQAKLPNASQEQSTGENPSGENRERTSQTERPESTGDENPLNTQAANKPTAVEEASSVPEPTAADPSASSANENQQSSQTNASQATSGANNLLDSINANREAASSGAEPTESNAPKVNAGRFVSRVANAFRAAQLRNGEIQLKLSPPQLGSLRLQISLNNGVLSASLETETVAAKSLLLENLPALRDRLAEQEIRIERFEVTVNEEGEEADHRFGGDRSAQSDSRESQLNAGKQRNGSQQSGQDNQRTQQTSNTNETALPVRNPFDSTNGEFNVFV